MFAKRGSVSARSSRVTTSEQPWSLFFGKCTIKTSHRNKNQTNPSVSVNRNDKSRFNGALNVRLQGVAEAELEKDLERTFNIFFFSSVGEVRTHTHTHTHTCKTRGHARVNVSVFAHRRRVPLSAPQASALEVRLCAAAKRLHVP